MGLHQEDGSVNGPAHRDEMAGYGTHLRRERDELVAEVAKLEAELAGYREALQRERKPDWELSLKELANRLEDPNRDHALLMHDCQSAARHLRFMLYHCTLKASFVPMRVALEKCREFVESVKEVAPEFLDDDKGHFSNLCGETLTAINNVLGAEK